MMTSNPFHPDSPDTPSVAETSICTSKYYPTDHQEPLGGVRRPLPLELAHEPEQQLRRKTPSGTLDAGYNATTGRLDGRKPPLKQLAVPATVDYTYYMHAVQHGHRTGYHSVPDATWQAPSIFANPSFNINPALWANNASDPNSATVFQSPYQPVIRAHEANLGAFCPPPPHHALGQTRQPWHSAISTMPLYTGGIWGLNAEADGYHTPRAVDAWHERNQWPLLPTSTNGPANRFQLQLSQTEAFSRIGHQDDFKEMSLAQGHSRYTALLGYVQSSGALGMRDLQHRSRSFRHLIFPKPPKAKRVSYTSRSREASCVYSSHPPGDLQPKELFATPAAQLYQNNYEFSKPQNLLGNPHTASNDSYLTFIQDIQNSIEILTVLCNQSTWMWTDGMLLLGCLQHAVENFEEAMVWFSRVLDVDLGHSESIANMAASSYCLGRYDEAEWHWIRALSIQPTSLDSVEHLVGLLYKSRSEDAIKIINNLQKSLKAGTPARKDRRQESLPSRDHGHQQSEVVENADAPQLSDTDYMLPPEENGRMLALIHAKGTMLYGRKQIQPAAEAFEEAVMISTGRCLKEMCTLIYNAQSSNSHKQNGTERTNSGRKPASALLLTPDKARQTAELVFGGNGGLPGLLHLTDKTQMRAAIHTTSNALLSLAKILQDALASGRSDVGLRRGPSGVGDILILYYLSLSLQESPSTANNVGILLAGIQQPHNSSIQPSTRSNISVQIPGVVLGSGLELALQYYNYGLKLDPKHVHLHTNLGSLLKDVGQLDLAIQMYERAVSCDGTFDIALTNLANAVKDKGRVKDAIKYYRRAIAANPNFAEAVCGLFTALNSVCNWRGRGGAMMNDGRYDRWHVTDDGRLIDAKGERNSSGLTEAVVNIIHKQLEDAVTWGQHILNESFMASLSRYCQSLSADSSFDSKSELLRWRRAPWEGTKVVRILERCIKVAMHARYKELYLNHRKSPQHTRIRPPADLSIPTAPTVLPFHTFTCPLSAADIRMISQRNALRISCSTLRSSWISEEIPTPPRPPSPHLNVGYVSSDFNNHPLAHLMQSVFGLHDSHRVRAHCYATTPSDKSTYRAQIEKEAPCFRDVSAWSVDRIVKQIAKDNIHILVNLNGYTRGARNEIFAARAAPVQMSFMGYAGTLAAEWCDYILADSLTIPECTLRPWRSNVTVEDVFRDDSEGMHGDWMYSENIIFCRDTFFCCDHAQSSAEGERDLTWEDEEKRRWKMRKELFPSIDNNTVILANFNQLYKIEPTVFRSWLRILASIPNAILWLLRFPEAGEANLKQSAVAWAGSEVASRIVFTDVAPKGQHISRARVCDLVLDTPECNAHTTAADVLWSSTPLLTLPRYPYKMCSRMAASILSGALPRSPEGEQIASELIVSDQASYEDTAVRLITGLKYNSVTPEYCTGEGRLADMRRVLWRNKWTCGLFDTKRWVRDVEDAYEEAWKRWVNGEGGDIWL